MRDDGKRNADWLFLKIDGGYHAAINGVFDGFRLLQQL